METANLIAGIQTEKYYHRYCSNTGVFRGPTQGEGCKSNNYIRRLRKTGSNNHYTE